VLGEYFGQEEGSETDPIGNDVFLGHVDDIALNVVLIIKSTSKQWESVKYKRSDRTLIKGKG